jgi:predicted RNA-binding Zn ribbon-like protein
LEVRLNKASVSVIAMDPGRESSRGTNAELCLDFADTVDWRTSDHADDQLTTYEDLLAWSRKKGLLGKDEMASLSELAKRRSGLEEGTVKDAVELREAIYHIFSAVAHQKEPDLVDVDVLNKQLGRSLQKSKVEARGKGFSLGWHNVQAPDMMLWPIARSAAELLTSDKIRTVRECANQEEGCGSLFLDYSKSHSKKWCSMKSCGNRAKLRTYYAKHNRP